MTERLQIFKANPHSTVLLGWFVGLLGNSSGRFASRTMCANSFFTSPKETVIQICVKLGLLVIRKCMKMDLHRYCT